MLRGFATNLEMRARDFKLYCNWRNNMQSLNGTWFYESFCPLTGTSDIPAQIAAPWAPRAELYVTSEASTGKLTGTLKFAPGVELTISGSLTPAAGKLPEGIELTGEGL